MHIHDAWWQYWIWGALAIGCSATLLFKARSLWQKQERSYDKLLAPVVALFGMVFGLFSANFVFGNTIYTSYQLKNGDFRLAEGHIERLVEEPWKGYSSAIFTVGDTRFSYYDYDTKTNSTGEIVEKGCLKEGLPAKVTYAGSRILSLELGYPVNEGEPVCRKRSKSLFMPPALGGLYRSR